MDQQEGLATNKPPLFTGENYANYWSVRMKFHLMSLGWKVWDAIVKEYKIDDLAATDNIELGQYEVNSKSLNEILSRLTKSVFTKVMRCKNAKQACDKLKTIYEGAFKVKESKL